MEDQLTRIKGYVTTFDAEIAEGALLDLYVELTVNRVLLYLNEIVLDPRLEMVVAQVVISSMNGASKAGIQTIASVSDNGQTVSYHQTPIQYYGSKSDQELFTGFTALLNGYRRPHVITR
jgi:hypothetical protein